MKLKLASVLTAGRASLNKLRKYLQWVFKPNGDIVSDNSSWAYENYGTGGEPVRIGIKDTQIATFDGVAYLQCPTGVLDGNVIVEFIGTSTPSLDYANDRILFTAGTAEYLKLSTAEMHFQESNGEFIYTIGEITNNSVMPYTLPFILN